NYKYLCPNRGGARYISQLLIRIKTQMPRCPSTDDWIKKTWSIYTMEYYSASERTITQDLQQHGRDWRGLC
uniref:Uncharacterized protein n=1 Tax=Ursus maritimus TaxID=29073 RepID=A0A452VEL4_URSMA